MGKQYLGLVLAIVLAVGYCDLTTGAFTYVKSMNFDNQSGQFVTITAKFKSGKSSSYQVLNGEQQLVQNIINMGTFQTVDPITNLKVVYQPTIINDQVQGIEARQYTINGAGSLTRTQ